MSNPSLTLEAAAALAKACAAADVTDPHEIAPLIAFAKAAEDFDTALTDHQRALQAYNHFIATHGADDPGQDYYVQQLASAREIYTVARRAYKVALEQWRMARGAQSPAAIAA